MLLRTATLNDIAALKDLYFNTITTVNAKDYNAEQTKAWASTADRIEGLTKKINEQYFYVAENTDKKITGFASLDNTGYLDVMYVHKDFQRQGIAQILLNKIIETALSLNITTIESEVSITAKPFFAKKGFTVVEEQSVIINGVALTNYKMQCVL